MSDPIIAMIGGGFGGFALGYLLGKRAGVHLGSKVDYLTAMQDKAYAALLEARAEDRRRDVEALKGLRYDVEKGGLVNAAGEAVVIHQPLDGGPARVLKGETPRAPTPRDGA